MPNELEQTSNYTLTKILRIGISPLTAMVGVSTYYGQYLKDPVLDSINSLLFSKKLGIDIWGILIKDLLLEIKWLIVIKRYF